MKKIDLEKALKNCGLKKTKHRISVLRALQQSSQPISAEQVFLILKQRGIDINLSTVYRTLDTLVAKDLVSKLNLSGTSKALFEFNRMVHRHYLVCMGCNKILTIEHCPLEDYENALADQTGFNIVGHRLDIYGYCDTCKIHV